MPLIRNTHNREYAGKAKDVEDLDKKVVSALGTGTNGQVLYKTATGVGFGDLPTPTDVEANPTGEATTDLSKLKVGNTIYGVGGGSGGGGTQLYRHTLANETKTLYIISTSSTPIQYDSMDWLAYRTPRGSIISSSIVCATSQDGPKFEHMCTISNVTSHSPDETDFGFTSVYVRTNATTVVVISLGSDMVDTVTSL